MACSRAHLLRASSGSGLFKYRSLQIALLMQNNRHRTQSQDDNEDAAHNWPGQYVLEMAPGKIQVGTATTIEKAPLVS